MAQFNVKITRGVDDRRHTKSMSFLDNLENNLNALERQEEKDPEKVKRDRDRREVERSAALQRAPHAEALKHSPFTMDLMTHCRTIGHSQRVLVQFTWLGENLRLDAKGKAHGIGSRSRKVRVNIHIGRHGKRGGKP